MRRAGGAAVQPPALLQRCCVRGARVAEVVSVDESGSFAALGAGRELVVVDLDWPWDARLALNVADLDRIISIDWQPTHRTVACAGENGSLRLCNLADLAAARGNTLVFRLWTIVSRGSEGQLWRSKSCRAAPK